VKLKNMEKKENLTVKETLALASQLRKKNDFQAAKQLYKQILEIEPDHVESIFCLGSLSAQTKNYDTAKQLLNKTIQINPNHAKAHNNLGGVLIELGEHEKAVSSFEKAIQIDPNHPDAHNNLGILLHRSGDSQKAISSFEKAIQIDPNHAKAYNNLGSVLTESGKHEKTISSFEKAIQIDPKDASAYSNLGSTLQGLNKHIEAVDAYQEAFAKRSGINLEVEKKLRPATNSFFLELTNKCNFHCEFCPSDSQTRLHGFMDLSLAKKIFDEIASKQLVKQVELHLMGEPTLHPKLNDILTYAKEKNVKVALTTNGSTLVKKRVPKLLESISGRIVASLMTPTKETYKIRGDVGLSWDRYVNNFRLLIQEHLNRISRKEKIEYEIIIRVMVSEKSGKGTVKVLETSNDIQENWNEWSKFVENAEKQLGLKPFKRPTIDSGTTLSLLSDYREISYVLQKGLKLQFWKAFTFANSRVSGEYELKYQKEAQYCPHPFTDLGVLWNGDVNMCCLDHDATLKVGDVRNHSIETVLKSAAAKKLRGSMYSLEELHPTCKKCQARPVQKVLEK
tara:strand:- start:126 stop:1820 length:1695 start_codon:yes stop_codon:yes gene_type:complete